MSFYRGPLTGSAPGARADDAPPPVDILLLPESFEMLWLIDVACWNAVLEWVAPSPDHGPCYDASQGQLVVPDPIEQDDERGLFA
jgi:hypothetical protein